MSSEADIKYGSEGRALDFEKATRAFLQDYRIYVSSLIAPNTSGSLAQMLATPAQPTSATAEE